MAFDIIKATDMAPGKSSIHVVAGPPGLGKSWFCGTVGEIVPPEEVLLIATLAREVKSVKYQQYNYDTIVCEDPEWEPQSGTFKSTGYSSLISTLRDLRDDEKYGAIILDSGTEAGELAWHQALEPWKVADPSEMGKDNRFAPYTALDSYMDEIVRSLSKLAGHPAAGKLSVSRPKHVIITWHVQPPKDTIGSNESADEKGEGVEYEGSVLPMIRGRFRRRLGQLIDSFVYADRQAIMDPKTTRTKIEYVIQVRSTTEKHCKFPGLLPDGVNYIPNSFPEFIKLVDDSVDRLKEQASK